MWGNLREWLQGGAIDGDPELISDLTGIEYGYVLRDGRDAIILERREDMKRRGLASPDNGDALALTFAYPVIAVSAARSRRPDRFYRSDYDPYAIRPEERLRGSGSPFFATSGPFRERDRGFADDDDVGFPARRW